MVEAVWGRLLSSGRSDRDDAARPSPWFFRIVVALRWASLLSLLALLGWGLSIEARTSYLQSRIFSRFAEKTSFSVKPGPSDTILFPKWGPYDERLGYAGLPSFIASLNAHGFLVERQAEWSAPLTRFVDQGGYATYTEKPRAGLKLFDRDQNLLYQAIYPERAYPDFASIPPLVVRSLLFVEDRDLLDPDNPRRNPTVEWGRFMLAVAGRVAGVFDHRLREGGASTLATQIEKFRHSPGGRTPGVVEKLRQMVSASVLAYRNGVDTNAARQQIMTTYLNSEPLASRSGYGEIIGVPEALWFWYGTDLTVANQVLTAPATTKAQIARKGEIYRQVLSLLLAGRRPAHYLIESRDALGRLTDTYLRRLAEAGVISIELHDAALRAHFRFRGELPPTARMSFIGNKATGRLRAKLISLLHLPDLYALDRLDLTGYGTIDTPAQKRITEVLEHLQDPAYDRSLGLVGKQLLDSNPARVAWSVVLYERGADRNYLRLHADSLLFSVGALYWTREEWTSEKLFYDLAVGALVSLLFYLLVARLPDYERRQRLKSSLKKHYEALREDCIEIMLQVVESGDDPKTLMRQDNFSKLQGGCLPNTTWVGRHRCTPRASAPSRTKPNQRYLKFPNQPISAS